MCDRTHEFLQLAQAAKVPEAVLRKSHKKGNEARTAFNEAASDVAKGIHRTSTLLAKLATLVKKQGLFDDPTEEINNLIHRIKQDLDELNTKCDTAQQFVDSQKSFFSGDGSQSSQHNNKVVSGLKTELMAATKDFKSVLELRSNKMKDQQQRKVELIGKGMISPMRDLELLVKKDDNNSLVKRKGPLPSPYAQDSSSVAANGFAISKLEENRQQQQLLLEPVATTQYYEAREKAVSEVEKTIGELGTLFKRLSNMLAEQQSLVERIDEDVENAVANTDNARNALLKAYESVSSNRGMYMKIGAIVLAFILFFVLFVL